MSTATLQLEGLEIHPVQRQVWLAGRSIALGARAFDVLLALAERRDRLVSKNELLDLVWPGQVVEENNLTVQISTLRKALGSEAISTVTGRGYRLALGSAATPLAAPVALASARLQRRLVALAQASVVGWSRLIARQATQAVAGWKTMRTELLEPSLKEFSGRPEELTPERMRVEFASAVDAAQWALHLQQQAAERTPGIDGARLHLRIAIVVDDAIVDDGKLLGMGIRNVDELHALAQHDEVLISDTVRVFVADKLATVVLPVDAGQRQGKASAQTLWLLKPQPAPAAQAASGAGSIAGLANAMRPVPALAVLPLRNLGPVTDAYLATGLTEQVINFLALNKSLAVIAHGSTLGFDQGSSDSQRAAHSLGVEYVLAGSLHRQDLQLQIQVSLTHVPSQTTVLQQPFVGSLGDVLGFQEQLAADIAAAIDPEVLGSELRLLMRRPTDNPSAYDCLLRGLALVHDFAHADAAAQHFQQAIGLDPGYAQAHAQLAWWHTLRVGEGRSPRVDQDRQAATEHANRAVELDPRDASVLAVAGHVRSFLGKQFAQAMALFDQALAINPSCAQAWARSATTLAYLGQGEQALMRVQQAMRLSPKDPSRFAFLTTRGTAALVLGRYDEACAWLAQARRLNPGYKAALRMLVAALALADDLVQARALADEFIAAEPGFSVAEFGRWYPLQEPHLSQVLYALRLAGMPH